MNFFKNGKLSGKSTAAIICFCLAAVAALGIFTYNRSANELKNELSGINGGTSETVQTEPEQSQAANIPAENVPKTEEETTAANANEEVILEHDAFGGSEDMDAAQPARAEKSVPDSVIIPVSGDIICDYSDGELVKSKTLSVWKTHDGIDIGAEQGAIVKSMTAGTVTSVTSDPMMGVTVIIDHGSGYEGYYCNLSKDVSVTEGDTVSTGTAIGTVGATAESEISEESHLHLGIKKNGSWTDPTDLLSGEGS